MKKISLLLSTFLFCQFALFAQNNTQVVKGTIIDKQSEMPLIGATISLINETVTLGEVTDIDGNFRLEGVPIGRQNFVVEYLGYESITIPNIVVTRGKEVVLSIAMEESIEELQEVVVTATVEKDKAQNEMATISARTFSVEEVNRFSGGRQDIARLATNFAGVSTADDSRNDIVIRGNSPTGVLWRLEGIPIPNPNHFSTLGTTGGPVSALNPNLLRNSDFLTSAFPAEYGNALAGVFDLGFRSGNKDAHEFMLQMGAISGLEGMAEGPLGKGGKASYLISGRYSFVGLAAQFGNIGTAATPNYRDIAFKLDFAKTKLGKFTLFGVGGSSDIDFLHDEVNEDDLYAGATDEDSFAKSRFGVAGIRHNLLVGDDAYVRTSLAVTHSWNEFINDRYYNIDTDEEVVKPMNIQQNGENKLVLSSYFNKKYSAKLTGRAGILVEHSFFDINAETAIDMPDLDMDGFPDLLPFFSFNETATIVQPYIQTQYRINKNLTLNAGLHAQYLTINEAGVVEPRVALNYKLNDKQTINLGYGLHHQTTPLPILLSEDIAADGTIIKTNQDLAFSRSQHYVLGYDYKFAKNWRAKLEAYYQDIDNVPVDPFESSFSVLNIGADFGFPAGKNYLVNEGTGSNRGLELTIEKFFSEGYYSLITTSLFDSKYTGSDGIERNTAFNNGYVLNVLFGKEFKIGKDKRNAITFDTKFSTAGGRYYTPVDLAASELAGREIRQDELAFSEQYEPYLRWDVKVGFQLNSKKRKLSQQIFFDIQNVTNRENIFSRRYNRQTNRINETYQSGLFPDFLYRLTF